MIIGPIIASFLLSTTSINGSIIINALSFLLSGIIISLIKINNIHITIKKENFFYEVKKGLKVIFKDAFVKNIIIIWGLLLIGVGITGSFIVILVTDYMGLPYASYVGLLLLKVLELLLAHFIYNKK